MCLRVPFSGGLPGQLQTVGLAERHAAVQAIRAAHDPQLTEEELAEQALALGNKKKPNKQQEDVKEKQDVV